MLCRGKEVLFCHTHILNKQLARREDIIFAANLGLSVLERLFCFGIIQSKAIVIRNTSCAGYDDLDLLDGCVSRDINRLGKFFDGTFGSCLEEFVLVLGR